MELVLEYTVRIMRDHVEQGHQTLSLIIPIIYYNGADTPYPYSCDIFDYFANRTLAEQLMFKPFQLIDVGQLSDEDLIQHRWSGSAF